MNIKDRISQNINDAYVGYGDFRSSLAEEYLLESFKECTIDFYLFLAENYHTEDESWSYSKLPKGSVQDRKTYDIIEIKDALKIYLEQKV